MENLEVYKAKLPNITELYGNLDFTVKNTELAIILNTEPKKEWVQYNSISKTSYIPIEIVEYLLTRIFSKWKVEVKETKLIANSIMVCVRLYYIDPITGEWEWQDGIGASPLQTDKGAGATEFDKIKNAAVMMAAPSAESFAIKDAAEKLGKIFGKDLNRKDAMAYDSLIQVNENRFKALEDEPRDNQ